MPQGKNSVVFGTAVVLDVALAAHERAHLLAGGVGVRIVRTLARRLAPAFDALDVRRRLGALGERADAEQESRARDPQLHQLRVVAVDAADRVRAVDVLELDLGPARDRIRRTGLDDLRVRGRVRHRSEQRESFEDVARAEPAVGRDHGRVAVEAVSRLRQRRHPLRLLLIGEHVGVTALGDPCSSNGGGCAVAGDRVAPPSPVALIVAALLLCAAMLTGRLATRRRLNA